MFTRPQYVEIGRPGELQFPAQQWMMEVEVGSMYLQAYYSLLQPMLQIGNWVHVLVHQVYLFEEGRSWLVENALKQPLQPISTSI